MSKKAKNTVKNEALTPDKLFENAVSHARNIDGFPVLLRPLCGRSGRNAGFSESFVTADFWKQLKSHFGVTALEPKVSDAASAAIKKLMEEYLTLEKEYLERQTTTELRYYTNSYYDSKYAFNREFRAAWAEVGSWIVKEFGDDSSVVAPKSHDEGVKNFLAIKKAQKDALEAARLAALERKLKRLKKTSKRVNQDKGE